MDKETTRRTFADPNLGWCGRKVNIVTKVLIRPALFWAQLQAE